MEHSEIEDLKHALTSYIHVTHGYFMELKINKISREGDNIRVEGTFSEVGLFGAPPRFSALLEGRKPHKLLDLKVV